MWQGLCAFVPALTDRQPFIRPGDGKQLWGETNLAVRPASVTERPHERNWQHSFGPGLGQQEYVYMCVYVCVHVCKSASCLSLFYGCLWKQEVMTSFHMVYMRTGWLANTEPDCTFKWFQPFLFFSCVREQPFIWLICRVATTLCCYSVPPSGKCRLRW